MQSTRGSSRTIDPARVQDILARGARGAVSAPVAAMQLLLAAGGDDPVEAALAAIAEAGPLAPPLSELPRLLRTHGARCAPVAVRARGPAATDVAGVAELFDAAAADSEEAAVALYSLGDPELLRRATGELVAALASLGVLGPDRVALDLGCGIGRVASALSSHLARIYGVDVSARMIDAARRRCAGVDNVCFAQTSGRDLALFLDRRFDLVLAVDALPYVHAAGLLDGCFAEIARVLRPGGDLVVVNLSYRGDLAADRADLRALAGAHGFAIRVDGATPFTIWDGVAFHLRRA